MRKIFILAVMSAMLTSCTVEDIINYLNGKENNLTESQKNEVDNQSNASQQSNEQANALIVELEADKDKGDIKPPRP